MLSTVEWRAFSADLEHDITIYTMEFDLVHRQACYFRLAAAQKARVWMSVLQWFCGCTDYEFVQLEKSTSTGSLRRNKEAYQSNLGDLRFELAAFHGEGSKQNQPPIALGKRPCELSYHCCLIEYTCHFYRLL